MTQKEVSLFANFIFFILKKLHFVNRKIRNTKICIMHQKVHAIKVYFFHNDLAIE